MFQQHARPDESPIQSVSPFARETAWLAAVSLAAVLTFGTIAQQARAASEPPEPFKVANIHFETNSSACDMGIQIGFDTDGITKGSVADPNGQTIYSFQTAGGMKATGGQAEGFLEGIEPQITELVSALGCEPSDEEGVMGLDDLLATWPVGNYTFEGQAKGATFRGQDRLTHHIPAGPVVVAPTNGYVFPPATPVIIDWIPVTQAILPELGPVIIVGYHVIVEVAGLEAGPTVDIDVPATRSSLTVPVQYLKPNKIYRFEVLSTERSGNQTITEGFFCTDGVAVCELTD